MRTTAATTMSSADTLDNPMLRDIAHTMQAVNVTAPVTTTLIAGLNSVPRVSVTVITWL